MGAMASQITSFTIVCSTVYSGADQRKHQSPASLAFMRGVHRWPVNSPHKGQVTRKMFPFDDVIMNLTTMRNSYMDNCYNAVNFPEQPRNRHPIARPSGRNRCISWGQGLIDVMFESLQDEILYPEAMISMCEKRSCLQHVRKMDTLICFAHNEIYSFIITSGL